MDYQALAELLFPDVTETPEQLEARFPQRNLPEGAVVSRMAPSPTGFVHLGILVQGTISERMTHQSGGVLYLRVEDTDAKREIPGAVEVLINTLKFYNINFDEGATVDGDDGAYGPYRQRQRAAIYHVYAKKLVSEGKAYPCFCTEDELSALREKQEANKETTGYYGKYAVWRDRPMEDIQAQLAAGNPWVLRFRSEGSIDRQFKFDDLVKGKLTITENNVDHVLLKSDGIPTYHFAHAGAAEQADLAALGVRSQQVDDLDAGLQNFSCGLLLCKAGCLAVDGPVRQLVHSALAVNGAAQRVEHTAQCALAHRGGQTMAGSFHRHTLAQTLAGRKHDAAHRGLVDVLRHLHGALGALCGHGKRLLQGRQPAGGELHIHHGACYANNSSLYHLDCLLSNLVCPTNPLSHRHQLP